MKQRWLPVAEREFDATLDYLIDRAGIDIATQFDAAVRRTIDRAVEYPEFGVTAVRQTRRLRYCRATPPTVAPCRSTIVI